MSSIRILGTGSYLPPQVVTNKDYERFIETSDEWIRSRTGMVERHIATDQPTWYLGAMAGEKAIAAAGLTPKDIDMVVVTTVSPDFFTPSMACFVQAQLQIPPCITLDINVACTAFCFGVDLARRYLATGDVTNVLLVSAESLSQITNYEDRSTCILFGDGAGACVITKGEGLYGSYQMSDPSGIHQLYATIPRKTHPFSPLADTSKYDLFTPVVENVMFMNGPEVYKFAVRAMPTAVEKACEKAGIAVKDLDLIIPHQANVRIIETAIKRLNISPDKVFVNIEQFGNTSSASAAIGLDQAVAQGRIRPGSKVCFVGFGAGLTYGATVFEY